MGWGFRRSRTIGGVRFTYSKSGISTSVGRKGFRITSGPRGVYVTTGFGGFYYRQRLGGRSTVGRPHAVPATPTAADPVYFATETHASGAVHELSDVSQEDFVRSLNEWTSRGALQWLAFAATAIALGALYALDQPTRVGETLLYGGVLFLLARFVELRRRRFLLVYDLDRATAERMESLGSAIQGVAESGSFRGVQWVGSHSDWKRHGGATRTMTFNQASIRRASAPYIVSNIEPWVLETQRMGLYFFPDRLLIRRGGRFAALSYAALGVDWHFATFVWDERVPHDAEVIGHTWLYVRKDGGPDRRFNGNRQIPEVRVGYLKLTSGTGLDVLLQSTRVAAVKALAATIAEYGSQRGDRTPDVLAGENVPSETRAALVALGLATLPTLATLKAAFRDLAQRNHPDRFATSSRDVRGFAEERMKEINAAYRHLLGKVVAEPSVESVPSPADLPESQPPSLARMPETWASIAAILACTVIFIGFRLSANASTAPAPTPEPSPVVASSPLPSPPPTVVSIRRDCVLRKDATATSRQVGFLKAGVSVEILDESATNKHVRAANGSEGYLATDCWKPPPRRAATKKTPRPPAVDAGPQPVDPYAGDRSAGSAAAASTNDRVEGSNTNSEKAGVDAF